MPDRAARGVSSGALQSSPFDKISGCNRVAYQKEEAGSLSALNFPPGICQHKWHRAYSRPSTVCLSRGTWKDEPVIGNQCKFCLMSPFDFLQAFWWMCAESGCSLTLRGASLHLLYLQILTLSALSSCQLPAAFVQAVLVLNSHFDPYSLSSRTVS